MARWKNITSIIKLKQPEVVKKGAAKQSRIKRVIWHLRWLASTRADISLQPSGSVRSKTDIKLWPSTLVRTGLISSCSQLDW